MKTIVYKRDKVCEICEKDNWISVPFTTSRLLLSSNIRESEFVLDERDYIIGMMVNGKEICNLCFELLVGLEDYFNVFYPRIISNKDTFEKAKLIINKIEKNPKLTDEIIQKYRSKGNFIPDKIIQSLSIPEVC